MKKKIIYLAAIVFLTFNAKDSFAQNKFYVSIHFPKELTNQKVEISYEDGRTIKKVPFLPDQNTITISDSFYYNRAIILIHIDSNQFNFPVYSSFFVGKDPASITINDRKNNTENVAPYTLTNAVDVIKIENQVEQFTAPESEAFNAFQSNPQPNDSSFEINKRLVRNWNDKKLDFIRQHKNEYFSFWLFKREVAPNFFMDPDSLMAFYKINFPDNFKNSKEGNKVMEILYGRKLASSVNMQAPEFNVTDINGKKIDLKDCRGKYVLINFWASWCGPCVGELPAIKRISDHYSPKELVIITNTIDSDSSAFLHALNKYGMTHWVNVYKDADLVKKFGGAVSIPQLFLIDPLGKVIYNRSYILVDNEKLSRLNKILKEEIQ